MTDVILLLLTGFGVGFICGTVFIQIYATNWLLRKNKNIINKK